MIQQHRTIHRLTWLLLAPLLLGLILVFNSPNTDPIPTNAHSSVLPDETVGKGVLP